MILDSNNNRIDVFIKNSERCDSLRQRKIEGRITSYLLHLTGKS